jgi:putative chitinase
VPNLHCTLVSGISTATNREAAMIDVSGVLGRLAPKAKANYVSAFADQSGLLDQNGINTPLRLAHFIAQFMAETGAGTVLWEDLSYSTPSRLLQIFGVGNHSAAIRPEEVAGLLNNERALAERVYGLGNPRKAEELGNTRPGDGYRYRGGGVLQTTGGTNYRVMGNRAGADFYNDPELIVAAEHALKPAVFEWMDGNLNAAADANLIRVITKKINGGYNGLDDRQHWFVAAWGILGGGAPAPPAGADASDHSTSWLQDALNRLGADPKLVVDGVYGDATKRAVRQFQDSVKIQSDGVAGEETRARILARLAAA